MLEAVVDQNRSSQQHVTKKADVFLEHRKFHNLH